MSGPGCREGFRTAAGRWFRIPFGGGAVFQAIVEQRLHVIGGEIVMVVPVEIRVDVGEMIIGSVHPGP